MAVRLMTGGLRWLVWGQPMDEEIPDSFFERELVRVRDEPPLPPLAKPCGDCAVVHGLYTVFSEALAKQPIETQRMIAERWWCHNHPGRACRGNMDLLEIRRR